MRGPFWGWRLDPARSGGGIFFEAVGHTLDILDFILGPIESVRTFADNQAGAYPPEDIVTGAFRYASGIHGSGAWCFAADCDDEYNEIVGATGRIRFSTFPPLSPPAGRPPVPIRLLRGDTVEEFPVADPPFVHQPLIETIVGEMNGRGECPSTGETAARTARVLEEASPSSTPGRARPGMTALVSRPARTRRGLHDTMTNDTFQFCRLDRDGAILTITIDRPEVLNALHLEAHVELARAFDAYAADPELRVAIVTGAGNRAFCVGTDLKALARTGPYEYPPGGFAGITKRFDLWKPVIAAVNGLCLGGGVEILAACDLAIAAEYAEFGLPEPLVGLAALGGGALQRLARHMPMKEAMWLVLTGKRIGAEEARRIGLVNEVVPRGEALDRARALAREMLACAPLALEASKQVMHQSLAEPDLAAAMRRSYPAAERMLASEDAKEGPRAFAEKRKPRWLGR